MNNFLWDKLSPGPVDTSLNPKTEGLNIIDVANKLFHMQLRRIM